MYSVGIVMHDMWTGRRAYWRELDSSSPPVNGVDEFVALARAVRPRLDDEDDEAADWPDDERRRRQVAVSSWRDLMQRCWHDDERISCKALLQLITALDRCLGDIDNIDDDNDDDSDTIRLTIRDEHFRRVLTTTE